MFLGYNTKFESTVSFSLRTLVKENARPSTIPNPITGAARQGRSASTSSSSFPRRPYGYSIRGPRRFIINMEWAARSSLINLVDVRLFASHEAEESHVRRNFKLFNRRCRVFNSTWNDNKASKQLQFTDWPWWSSWLVQSWCYFRYLLKKKLR